MRRRERFVQVVVHHVNPQRRRLDDTQQRVHIRAVAVNEAARFMNHPRHIENILVKKAERIRVGNHNSGQLVVAIPRQILQIDVPARVRLDRLAGETAHDRRRRVRPVRAVRDQHDLTLRLPLVPQVRGDHLHAAEFGLRPGGGRQRSGRHSAQFA